MMPIMIEETTRLAKLENEKFQKQKAKLEARKLEKAMGME